MPKFRFTRKAYKDSKNKQESISSLISPSAFEDEKHLTGIEAKEVFKRHDVSFGNAWNGIVLSFRTQPNFRYHVLSFVLAIVLGLIVRISVVEFLAILISASMVFVAEMLNTAIEAAGDELAQGAYRKLVGIAKDIAAGAVLLSAINAIIIGLVIFLPRVIDLIF